MLATIVVERLESLPTESLVMNLETPRMTGIAVYEGSGRWTALCVELDIAAMGVGADDAMVRLQAAVRDAMDLADEMSLSVGSPVPEEALAELLSSHQEGAGAPQVVHFPV
jgi:hypothetical protein